MRTSWSRGHATHNKIDNESWKAETGLIGVTQWKLIPRHQYYWNINPHPTNNNSQTRSLRCHKASSSLNSQFSSLKNQRTRESFSHKLNKFGNNSIINLNILFLQRVFILLKIKTLMDLPLWVKLTHLQNLLKTYTNKLECMDPTKLWVIVEN